MVRTCLRNKSQTSMPSANTQHRTRPTQHHRDFVKIISKKSTFNAGINTLPK